MNTLRLQVSTPTRELELDGLAGLRFATHDGWRGIRPGHEPGRASLRRGPLRCALAIGPGRLGGPGEGERIVWLASEGGVILIARFEVRVLTPWVASAESLSELRAQVEVRDLERARLEDEARALGHRHEVATRRALMALERKVAMP